MNSRNNLFKRSVLDVGMIGAAFLLWIVIFRDFVFGKLALVEDSISYYEHIRFYVENLGKGVFPLWDPWWFCGSANAFFLQRMGCFNPFLVLVPLFRMFGVGYENAYILYAMVYYFTGCIGFYLLARRVIKDRVGAFTAFILLLYSALGTRVFDSFIILMFTPIAWFFYFLVSFSERPQRHSFLGMVLVCIIVFTTYIPFYFIVTVLTFIAAYTIIYWRVLPEIILGYLSFFNKNRLLAGLGILLLLVSLVPGFLFFKAGGKGEYLMPKRNSIQAAGSVLEVKNQGGFNGWALLEEFIFSGYYYTDVAQMPFAVVYFPLLSLVVMGFGFLTGISRTVSTLFLWIAALVVMCMPNHAPVYGFLYKHVFFFKYFRNLHFFLWVTIMPAFCLLVGEQFKSYLNWKYETFWQKAAGGLYVTVVHGFGIAVLHLLHCSFFAAYVLFGLSYLFFLWRIFGSTSGNPVVVMTVLLVLAVVDPFEIYGYLAANSHPSVPFRYAYDLTGVTFHHLRNSMEVDARSAPNDVAHPGEKEEDPSGERVFKNEGMFYYVSKGFAYLSANVDTYVLEKYVRHRFVLYDAVEPMDESPNGFLALENALAENRNTAFVSTQDRQVFSNNRRQDVPYYARPISEDGEDFRVEWFNANAIAVKTRFNQAKFVVYNDNFHEQWKAYMNGRQVPIIRSNVAFKGLWVPAGDQTLEFRFGSAKLWMVYISLMAGVSLLCVMVVLLAWKERNENRVGVSEDLV